MLNAQLSIAQLTSQKARPSTHTTSVQPASVVLGHVIYDDVPASSFLKPWGSADGRQHSYYLQAAMGLGDGNSNKMYDMILVHGIYISSYLIANH